jgi:hypothetical protein
VGWVCCRTYLWFDDKGKKTRVAAPQYIDYVMTFTQKTISDESIFPTKYGECLSSLFSKASFLRLATSKKKRMAEYY